jgi:tetratricopeptide (TPR) repeat protein
MARSMEQPYPGARPFGHADSGRFFGRTAKAADLAEMWRTNLLTIVHGHAGVGKTSLLCAGVLPLLAGGKADVLPPGLFSIGSTFPQAALPEHNPYTLALLRSWSPGESASRLIGLTVRDFVSRRAERHGSAMLASIDQAEVLLADPGPRRTHRRRFLGELAEALRDVPRLHLLLSVREDALGEFSDALGGGARYRVTPLSPDRALDAVTGPVEGTGRSFAAGAADELVADLLTSSIVAADGRERSIIGVDHIEPALLQAVCVRLWESLPADVDVITERHVRRYGDADTALAIHCGRVIATVAEDHNLPAARLRSWLIRTFVTDLGTRGTAYEGTADTAGMPNAVPRALEDRHLLSAERRSGSRWYELLSERLIEPLRHAANELPPMVEPAEYLRSAEQALTLGELDLAERYAKETLRTTPGSGLRLRAEATSLLGNLAHEREKPADAEVHYRTAASLFEAVQDTGAVASQLAAVGQALLAQGQPADAVQELRAAADRVPNDLMVQTELGWALWELGQSRAAVAVLTGVLGIDGGNPDALRARGEILADLGDARDALRDLDRVTDRDRPSARAARGLALAELGDGNARKEIEGALADAPRNGQVLLYAARAEFLGGDKVAAQELARRALNATDPPLPPHQRQATLRLVGESPDDRQ